MKISVPWSDIQDHFAKIPCNRPLMGMKEIPHLLKALSQTLQEIRYETGVSQRELAKRMESTKSFIAAMEGGKNQPSLQTFLVIAETLGISPEELIKRLKAKLLLLNSSVTQSGPRMKTKMK